MAFVIDATHSLASMSISSVLNISCFIASSWLLYSSKVFILVVIIELNTWLIAFDSSWSFAISKNPLSPSTMLTKALVRLSISSLVAPRLYIVSERYCWVWVLDFDRASTHSWSAFFKSTKYCAIPSTLAWISFIACFCRAEESSSERNWSCAFW